MGVGSNPGTATRPGWTPISNHSVNSPATVTIPWHRLQHADSSQHRADGASIHLTRSLVAVKQGESPDLVAVRALFGRLLTRLLAFLNGLALFARAVHQ